MPTARTRPPAGRRPGRRGGRRRPIGQCPVRLPTATRAALAYALFALADVRWEPGTAAERLSIAEELAAAAAAAGETELVLEAHLSRLVALLELGDPSFTVQLDSFTRLAERAAIPRYLYLARSRQATAASLTGPLEKADELIAAAAAYGERIGEPDIWAVESSQLVGLAFIRHDWTRLNALAAARGQVLTPPEFAWHERAWLLIEAGDTGRRGRPGGLGADQPGCLPLAAHRDADQRRRAGRGCGGPAPVRGPVRAAAADGG